MAFIRFATTCCLIVFSFTIKTCTGLSDLEQLHTDVLFGYNSHFRPVVNYTDAVHVGIASYIVSIIEFDGLSGKLSLKLVLNMTWQDEHIKWNPSKYNSITNLLVRSNEIWMPELYFQETFTQIRSIGIGVSKLRVYYDGTVIWPTGDVMYLLCSVDVTYFPFDIQTCQVSLSSLYYSMQEIGLYSTLDYLSLAYYKPNTQWRYLDGRLASGTLEGGLAMLTMVIRLQRRAEFFIVYIILPVVFLCNLNILVFIMPVASGERTSVSITTFLSFVVFMQMVSEHVPPSSRPVAYIFYYLMFVMAYSSTIMLLCIFSLKIHSYETQVPSIIKLWVRCFRCFRFKSTKNTLSARSVGVEDSPLAGNSSSKRQKINQPATSIDVDEITWTLVGDTFDKVSMVVLLVIFWTFSFVSLTHLLMSSGVISGL